MANSLAWISATKQTGGQTWAQDQTSVANGGTGLSLATSFSPSANAFIAVWVLYRNDSSQTITSVTDNATGGSNTYTSAFNIANVNTHYTIAVFYCTQSKAGVSSITVNVPTSQRINVIIKSYTGSTGTTAIDQTATQSSSGAGTNSATQTSPSITTTGSNDLLLGYVFQNTDLTHTFSATSPWSLVNNEPDSSDGAMLGAEDNLNQPVGTYNAAFTTTAAITWWCSITSFKGS